MKIFILLQIKQISYLKSDYQYQILHIKQGIRSDSFLKEDKIFSFLELTVESLLCVSGIS